MLKFPGFLLLLFCLHAEAQLVPNGDFENWEIRDHFKLAGWYSSSSVERSTDAFKNSYSITLSNTKLVDGRTATSIVHNNQSGNDSLSGFAFDKPALSMVFHAKYDLALGDSAYIRSYFLDKGRYIGWSTIKIEGTSNGGFNRFSVPINYSGPKSHDTVLIYMSSLSSGDTVNDNGYILIDDFHFENIGTRYEVDANCDFENWHNIGVEFPSNWLSLDILAYDYWGGFLRNKSAQKTSESYQGAYAIALRNYANWNGPGRSFMAYGLKDNSAWVPSVAVAKRHSYFSGMYQFKSESDDSAFIGVLLFQEGGYVASETHYIGESTLDWTPFNIEINYYSSTSIPDSAAIRFYSSNHNPPSDTESELILDNISFGEELLLGQDNPGIELALYPNPASTSIYVSGLESGSFTYVITSLLGKKVVASKTTNSKTIKLHSLASGSYFIRIKQNQNQWIQKLIKI